MHFWNLNLAPRLHAPGSPTHTYTVVCIFFHFSIQVYFYCAGRLFGIFVMLINETTIQMILHGDQKSDSDCVFI